MDMSDSFPEYEKMRVGESISSTASAKAAGLRYVTDAKPGIQRKRVGKYFSYIDCNGKIIREQDELKRIRSLAIPPAWTQVWICSHPRGHIQATGRDAKGRKQYRYHPEWHKVRDETKYDRMVAFGYALSRLRKQVAHDLTLPDLPREKVLATVVQLLDTTALRIGNEEYVRDNSSFGLTTMRDEHVRIRGETLHLQFRGKRGKEFSLDIRDRQLARIVRRCRDLPGQELFQYVDSENTIHSVVSDDVNEYIRGITGQDFTAKDFRTWAGTVMASCALQELGECETQTQARKNIVHAIETTAQLLGNTPAICRKSYVHPEVIGAYLDGSLLGAMKRSDERKIQDALSELQPVEIRVLEFLTHH